MSQELDPTGAPAPLKLQSEDGVTYEFKAYPFRDIDHAEFDKWCRREYLDRVKQATDDEELLAIAISRSLNMTWMGEGRIVAMTVRGIHKMACLLCRDQKIDYKLAATSEGVKEITSVFTTLHPKRVEASDNGDGQAEGN